MLVTAVALFFSTFSSPLLSALLTLGLWVAGHFNADLRHFERSSTSPVAAGSRGCFYYLLPNLAPFDVKAEVVHGVPVPSSHVAYTLLYAAVYIAMLLLGGHRDLPAAGLQMTIAASSIAGCSRSCCWSLLDCASGGRDRGWQPYEPAKPVLWLQSGPPVKRAVAWLRALAGRPLLDPRGRLLRRQAARRPKPRRELRSAVPAARSRDDASTRGFSGVSLWRDLSVRGLSRVGRAGPTWRRAAAARRCERQPDAVGIPARHRVHLLLVATATTRPRSGSTRAGSCPARRLAASRWPPTTLAQGGDRRSSRFLWQQDPRDSRVDWLKDNAEQRLAQLDAMDAIDPAQSDRRSASPPGTAIRRGWQELVAGGGCAAFRSIRRACPYVLDPATGRDRAVSRESPLWPLPTEPAAGSGAA